MRSTLDRIPLSVSMIGATGALMLVPAVHGFSIGLASVGRGFFYSALIIVGLSTMLAIAGFNRKTRPRHESLFPTLASIYLVVPAVMAIPLAELLPQMRYIDAWFEMSSNFTTTGATLLDLPRQIPDPIHLWRGMAGWLGGLFILAAAMALLAPLRLGGFEMLRPSGASDGAGAMVVAPGARLRAQAWAILPVYATLTGALWVLLVGTGLPTFEALMMAMSVLSTSGILSRETLGGVGMPAEILLFLFMALALTRRSLPGHGVLGRAIHRDPEVLTAMALVGGVTAFVAARHWLGAFEATNPEDLPALGRATWGAAFTSLSFLTTTGLVSESWVASRAWSGLTPPGLVLMGLALLGGGVATTAGGLKLMRVFALWRLSVFESQRMFYPSMVVGGSATDRFLLSGGARSAWLVVMVFTLTAIVTVALLLLFGMSLETALVFTVAALTNTGPLAAVAVESPLYWVLLNDPSRLILGLAMILGRLEILVLLAALMGALSRR